MDVIRLGLAGFGTVGTGLARILDTNGERIAKRLGKRIEIRRVLVRDLTKQRTFDPGTGVAFTTDPDVLVNDPDIDIVVELMGGLDTAKALMLKAFGAGKHVVTANKHLLAVDGLELFEAASASGVGLMFEASCAGGIPIVQTLKENLAGDEVVKMLGIVNGTANY
ncbi:MAG: homoserine dehydrogenase, partial [Proteobacteria bacterium]|nr:homoserine dehydrogenase [Pseudomonadota bacterium]